MSARAPVISDRLIETVGERLANNKRVRRVLPLNGRLHIDRQLPFLVVYRQPIAEPDKGTRQLVVGEASYLIASADPEIAESLHALVLQVVSTLSPIFNAFLLVELWAAPPLEDPGSAPKFRVITPDPQAALNAADTLVAELNQLSLSFSTEARAEKSQTGAPPNLLPLISPDEANQLRCFTMGLEVPILYRSQRGDVFPEVLSMLHESIARSLKRTFYVFAVEHTKAQPSSYLALGRRAVVRAVSRADDALTSIGSAFDFLLAVTPINLAEAWQAFKKGRFKAAPEFRYRPLPINPDLLKRELYNIPIENIEDPTLGRIFREKQRELARQLTMLSERNTHRFLYGSLQLYGKADDTLLQAALELLISLPEPTVTEGPTIDAKTFAALATAEREHYQQYDSDFTPRIEIREDITGLLVSKGDLLIGQRLNIAASRADALLQHEVGTHMLTYANGRAQPIGLLSSGMAGYEALQEGLAVLSEYLVGGLNAARLRLLAARVVAARRLTEEVTFTKLFHELMDEHALTPIAAFRVAARTFRGGGLTKDAIYLQGFVELLTYLREGGELEHLFIGKIALQHLPLLEELRQRQVLRAAPLKPRYLERADALDRLARLRSEVTLTDLVSKEFTCE